ncbi:hypothetical protein SERLADRAFT_466237 [Serpula lacrymans var. lacrymans S7.9]|uniref:Uncharacterized protein n=1 Tax=Serpula lacrymans var. lacrymans (strain S7.9) TaxID=578457 RepID=F8NTM6_SERL9|nr:uncharacterized protein SERLADRAFT_466237 [Serpula lacrymans var. lacrymans S7.9]EGO25698.1 hypothetical protein SERLADRAFT_466237 [Serpula lacrymans var. lacrymans S7.9]
MQNNEPEFDLVAALATLPETAKKCSNLEKGRLYNKLSVKLLYQCQRYSAEARPDIKRKIGNIQSRITRLNTVALLLMQENNRSSKWDPRKIIKMYYQNRGFAEECLAVLNFAKITSDEIMRTRAQSSEDRESQISITTSFFTAIDIVTQGDADLDENDGDGADMGSRPADGNQTNEQILGQVQNFAQALQSIPIRQLGTSDVTVNQTIIVQSIVNRGSGTTTNPTINVGGSNTRGEAVDIRRPLPNYLHKMYIKA